MGDANKDHAPRPVDLAAESVAGEEDPGASIDMATAPKAAGHPAGAGAASPSPSAAPGDEAPPGSASTGEDVCPACGGSGRQAGRECPQCGGTGKVTVGIGGG